MLSTRSGTCCGTSPSVELNCQASHSYSMLGDALKSLPVSGSLNAAVVGEGPSELGPFRFMEAQPHVLKASSIGHTAMEARMVSCRNARSRKSLRRPTP